jgi:hypothetical protein
MVTEAVLKSLLMMHICCSVIPAHATRFNLSRFFGLRPPHDTYKLSIRLSSRPSNTP